MSDDIRKAAEALVEWVENRDYSIFTSLPEFQALVVALYGEEVDSSNVIVANFGKNRG